MPFVARPLLDIFTIFVAAKLAAELFSRLRQPPVIGELLAGVLIGPFALGRIGHPDATLVAHFHTEAAAEEALRVVYEVLAQIGVMSVITTLIVPPVLSALYRGEPATGGETPKPQETHGET